MHNRVRHHRGKEEKRVVVEHTGGPEVVTVLNMTVLLEAFSFIGLHRRYVSYRDR